MKEETTVGLVIIGNEILSGKVADTNAQFAIGQLREAGARLVGINIVPDDVDIIAEAITDMLGRSDWVVTSGGIGPTHDDVTKDAVARALGVGMMRDPIMEGYIRRAYGDKVNDMQLRMADIPDSSEIENRDGFSAPILRAGRIFVLAGIPQIFEACFSSLIDRFRALPFSLRSVYLNILENDLAEVIAAVADRHPSVDIGSYPKIDNSDYKLRITFESKDQQTVDRAIDDFLQWVSDDLIFKSE